MAEKILIGRTRRYACSGVWAAILVMLSVLNVGWLDPVRDQVEQANRKYLMGDHDGALKDYTQAQTERPEEPALHFNIGNVQVRKENLQEAAREYQQAATSTLDRVLESQSLYNLGNVLAM
ncbi:MAG TPA: tetratricopeptide repeat protein, partial [bacterium]|nr:tetratricopeptide repeat protein [bacterium]